jgi:large subunit ribosomal protein L22
MSVLVKNESVQVSGRKVRLLCDLIRKKKVDEALSILRFNQKRSIALVLTKLVNSGLSIATDSQKYDLDNLYISRLQVDEGPTMKRIQSRAQGRAYRIRLRTCKILIELKEK